MVGFELKKQSNPKRFFVNDVHTHARARGNTVGCKLGLHFFSFLFFQKKQKQKQTTATKIQTKSKYEFIRKPKQGRERERERIKHFSRIQALPWHFSFPFVKSLTQIKKQIKNIAYTNFSSYLAQR